METPAEKFLAFVATVNNPAITLLRQPEVVRWLFGDTSFLPPIVKKNKTADTVALKALEDAWGQKVLKARRPDLKLDKQWTTCFGQHIAEEVYTLLGKTVKKPTRRQHYEPDCETEDAVIEVKTQTYYTTGTAGEKILGCPFKYAEIPDLYGKPLQILCLGGAEAVCRDCYGNLPGAACSPQKKKFLDFFAANRIQFVAVSQILASFKKPSSE